MQNRTTSCKLAMAHAIAIVFSRSVLLISRFIYCSEDSMSSQGTCIFVRRSLWFLATLLAITNLSVQAQQQSAPANGGTDASAANDPTSPIPQIQTKDSYHVAYEDRPGQGNAVLIRPVLPLPAKGLFASSITRVGFTLESELNGRTGLGDTAYETFFLPNIWGVKEAKLKLGLGPYIVAPSATNRYAGQGQWQVGPAAIVLDSHFKGLLLGVIEEDAITVSGEHARPGSNIMLIQPLIVKSFPNKTYFRFDPTWSFNFKEHGTGTIPLNLGFGRVMKLGPQEFSAYIQPEFLARRPYPDTAAIPRVTLRFSVTLLYPKKKKG